MPTVIKHPIKKTPGHMHKRLKGGETPFIPGVNHQNPGFKILGPTNSRHPPLYSFHLDRDSRDYSDPDKSRVFPPVGEGQVFF
jgi:hypothetical protein